MVGVNIFARRAEPQLELELTKQAQEESYLGATGFGGILESIMGDAVRMAGGTLTRCSQRSRSYLDARCGGRFKKNSIKQRTRLNRDKRNRERRWAKHAQQFGYRHYESNYANQ